jgi:hypothetical protein
VSFTDSIDARGNNVGWGRNKLTAMQPRSLLSVTKMHRGWSGLLIHERLAHFSETSPRGFGIGECKVVSPVINAHRSKTIHSSHRVSVIPHRCPTLLPPTVGLHAVPSVRGVTKTVDSHEIKPGHAYGKRPARETT